MNLKQIPALLLALALCLPLCACSSEKTPGTAEEPVAEVPTEVSTEILTEAAETVEEPLTVGDEVETEDFRFTLKTAEFTDKILVCNGEKADKDTYGNAEEFFTPSDEPFVDENGNVIKGIHGFAARKDSDNVYLYYNIEMEFIGKEEYGYVTYDFKPIVQYGEYTFDSDYMAFGRIIDKVKFNNRMWFNFNSDGDGYALVKALGLELGGFSDRLKPLSSDVYEIRGIIQVPKTVAENTEEGVSISFCGQEFIVR